MTVSRGSDQFVLRMPLGMRDVVKKLADENMRSMNAEFVFLLKKALEEVKGGDSKAAAQQ